jgi:hypothetical protein
LSSAAQGDEETPREALNGLGPLRGRGSCDGEKDGTASFLFGLFLGSFELVFFFNTLGLEFVARTLASE